jgi:hypothetical protein
MRVVANNLLRLTSVLLESSKYVNLLHEEKIRFWDNKLGTTSSLLHVQSPEKARTSEENINRIP